MTESELLAGDLLTACTLLAQEKELADALAADLRSVLDAAIAPADRSVFDAAETTYDRYRQARPQ